VNVEFEGVAGATGYTISRDDKGLLTPTPIQASSSYTHSAAFTAPLD
jgi:hypothetical protein